ncbi:MAG: hypothetical protein O9972_27905 [Burkholderiales bacterium]|nr:hypothetical protein [Burkholderiales bacterium]
MPTEADAAPVEPGDGAAARVGAVPFEAPEVRCDGRWAPGRRCAVAAAGEGAGSTGAVAAGDGAGGAGTLAAGAGSGRASGPGVAQPATPAHTHSAQHGIHRNGVIGASPASGIMVARWTSEGSATNARRPAVGAARPPVPRRVGHGSAHRRDGTRLRLEADRGRARAAGRRAVVLEVGAADARGPDLEHDLARPGRGIREVAQLEPAIAEEGHTLHVGPQRSTKGFGTSPCRGFTNTLLGSR